MPGRRVRHAKGVLEIEEAWFPIGVGNLWHARYNYRDLRRGEPDRTAALVGRRAQVVQAIDPVLGTGRVNVGGDDWAARCTTSLPAGAEVVISGADGIVLLVAPARPEI